MKKMISLLMAGLLLMALAANAEDSVTATHGNQENAELEIRPHGMSWDGIPNGRYGIRIKETDHLEDGYFSLSLYAEDLYQRDAIENMKQGDTIRVNEENYTVEYVCVHGYYDSDGDNDVDLSFDFTKDDGHFIEVPDSFEPTAYEVIMREAFDGYIVFEPISDSKCRSVINDWSPCHYLGDITISLPLREDFVFVDYADIEGDEQSFLDDVSEGWYSPYNSYAWFENGQLIKIRHSDYPVGPEPEEEPDA